MPMPTAATVTAHGVRTPREFNRVEFIALGVTVHRECDIELEEVACFMEPHEDGSPHLNLLVRSGCQYRWLKVAQRFLTHHKVHVNFAPHIKTWMEGVVYGKVASEHKGPERLDQDPRQWAKSGSPTPLEQFLPKRWQEPGFSRQTRLTPLAFFDLCVRHNVVTETGLWAKAQELSEQGDRGMLAYVLEHDGEAQLAKVLKATSAKELARRQTLTREALLEEYLAKGTCSCSVPGQTFTLMKDLLAKNGLDGRFQAEVLGARRAGRKKMRAICLVGDTNCGKSFLLKGLRRIFFVYERPEGGTHQLENLLGKEVLFLNDFEYDAKTQEWMPWQYFKNLLEGGEVTVARPKTRGSNVQFKDSAPVLMTAPGEVTLWRRGQVVQAETKQMRTRIRYLELTHELKEEERQETDAQVCGHCSARVYLEGRSFLDAANNYKPAQQAARAQPSQLQARPAQPEAPQAKRQRTAQECVKELVDLKNLLDCGAVTTAEFTDLKGRLLQGD